MSCSEGETFVVHFLLNEGYPNIIGAKRKVTDEEGGYRYTSFQWLLTGVTIQPELASSARTVIYALLKDACEDPRHLPNDRRKFDCISSW